MSEPPLSGLDVDSINNIYIFLADALRYDELPDEIGERGVYFKTVAHALTTPQCLPTISSGRLPPKHGVTWFNYTIPEDLPTFFDFEDINTGYSELYWLGHALHDVLGRPERRDLETAKEPFLVFEHDNGGHAPYPEEPGENPSEMLQSMGSKEEVIKGYQNTVQGSVVRFNNRLSILEDRGLRDNTLVIFLSDHGELLGEHGGFFGHQLPMTPECVYVPMVFSHPSLPSGESREHLLQQTDLYPTITNLLTDRDVDSDGDLLTGPIKKGRPAYSRTIVQPPRKFHGTILDPAYDAQGIWTRNGGHVFVENSKFVRIITSFYEALLSGHTAAYNSHRNRIRTLGRALNHYLKDYKKYGSPTVEKGEARQLIKSEQTTFRKSDTRELTEETKEQLADLGYQ
jgi:hypothetical protein